MGHGFTEGVSYRSADVPTRQRYVKLVESVKDNGGNIRIFSSLHISGEREWFVLWGWWEGLTVGRWEGLTVGVGLEEGGRGMGCDLRGGGSLMPAVHGIKPW